MLYLPDNGTGNGFSDFGYRDIKTTRGTSFSCVMFLSEVKCIEFNAHTAFPWVEYRGKAYKDKPVLHNSNDFLCNNTIKHNKDIKYLTFHLKISVIQTRKTQQNIISHSNIYDCNKINDLFLGKICDNLKSQTRLQIMSLCV